MPWHDTLSIASKTQTHDGRVQRSKWNAESLHSSTRSMSMIDSRTSAEVGLRFEDFIILSWFYKFYGTWRFCRYNSLSLRHHFLTWFSLLPHRSISRYWHIELIHSVQFPFHLREWIKQVANESTTLHSNPPRCKFHDSKNVEKTNIHNCSSVHITSIITFSYVYTSSQFLII